MAKQEIPKSEIDPNIAVGATAPAAVALHPIAVEVVEVVPQFRGHLHFVLVGQRIVIVGPRTMRFVTDIN